MGFFLKKKNMKNLGEDLENGLFHALLRGAFLLERLEEALGADAQGGIGPGGVRELLRPKFRAASDHVAGDALEEAFLLGLRDHHGPDHGGVLVDPEVLALVKELTGHEGAVADQGVVLLLQRGRGPHEVRESLARRIGAERPSGKLRVAAK